uniref:hypothetical protein n=1 Tax=Hymenobacter terrenus TaxID=1629124 RepID=UPI000619C43C
MKQFLRIRRGASPGLPASSVDHRPGPPSRGWARLALLPLSLLFSPVLAQSTLEFAPGAGNPTGSGPSIAPQVITFQNNPDNPVANTFTPFTPTTTATFTLSNQQYALSTLTQMSTGTGVAFGAGSNSAGSAATALALFPALNSIGASTDANYTSVSGASGGLSTTANNGVEVYTSVEGLPYNAPPNARYQFADLTITFNRAVVNPVVHLTGLGSTTTTPTTSLGISTELDLLTPGLTLSELSGSPELDIRPTQIRNSAAVPAAATGSGAASGSVQVTTPAAGITSLQFRIFLRGQASGGGLWHDLISTTHSGDGWLIGVSALTPGDVL